MCSGVEPLALLPAGDDSSPTDASFDDGATPVLEPASPGAPSPGPGGRHSLAGYAVTRRGSGSGTASPILTTPGDAPVEVFIRVRPMTANDVLEQAKPVVVVREDVVLVLDPKTRQVRSTVGCSAAFDGTAPASEALGGQPAVFDAVGRPLLDAALEGYSVALLTYGQTGAGKTYTLLGAMDGPDAGVTPRLCRSLFDRLEALRAARPTYTLVEATFCEVYNEKVKDLLAPRGQPPTAVRIRQSSERGAVIEGLARHPVTSAETLLQLLGRGIDRRSAAATDANPKSSRSHALLMLHLTQRVFAGEDVAGASLRELRSTIHLVDLAGSERVRVSDAKEPQPGESEVINPSLSTLGRVIDCLANTDATPGKSPEAPFRESTLTWLLKSCFGGNCRTALLAAVQPSGAHVEETLSTLRFISRAPKVVNRISAQVKERVRTLDDLRGEAEALRAQLTAAVAGAPEDLHRQTATVEQLRFLEHVVQVLQRSNSPRREAGFPTPVTAGPALAVPAPDQPPTEPPTPAPIPVLRSPTSPTRKAEPELQRESAATIPASTSEMDLILQLQKELTAAHMQREEDAVSVADLESQLRLQRERTKLAEARAAAAEDRASLVEEQQIELESRNTRLAMDLTFKEREHEQLSKELTQMARQIAALERQKSELELQRSQLISTLQAVKQEPPPPPPPLPAAAAPAADREAQQQQLQAMHAEFAQLREMLEGQRQATEEQQRRSCALEHELAAEREMATLREAHRALQRECEAAVSAKGVVEAELQRLQERGTGLQRTLLAAQEAAARRAAEARELDATLRAVREELGSFRQHADVLKREVRKRDAEIETLRKQKTAAESQKLELKAALQDAMRMNKELNASVASQQEQLEELERVSAEMSAEYNRRLTKIVTDSDEWKRLVEGVVPEPPPPPPAPAEEPAELHLSFASLFKSGNLTDVVKSIMTPRSRGASPHPTAVSQASSGPPGHAAHPRRCRTPGTGHGRSASRDRAPLSARQPHSQPASGGAALPLPAPLSGRPPALQSARCPVPIIALERRGELRRAVYGRDAQSPADSSVDDSASSSSASEASFCAVELVDEVHPETLEEVALLKLQNRVLESNLESMQRVLALKQRDGALSPVST